MSVGRRKRMEYRILGRSGIRVGEIGLGCEGFTGRDAAFAGALLDTLSAAGGNCIDLFTSDPQVRSDLGAALKGRRERFVLQAHLCSVWKNGQYRRTRKLGEVRAAFEDLLERLGTDVIDIGMIHYVDSLSDWKEVCEGGVLRYAKELKEQGRIRAIGLSSHNPEVALAAAKTGEVEVLMFSVNPCYDLQPAGEDVEALWADESYEHPLVNMDPQRQELYETCQSLGVGITVMKAFGGGDLLDAELSPAGAALTVDQCLHYALTRPAVACVMSGARTVEELERSLAYEDASEQERDYAEAFAAFPKISWEGHCMYCGHCAPCPVGISVADVTKFLNLAVAQGRVPESVREHYGALPHAAGECIECGGCESRCPFGVGVIDNMRAAAKLFGR